MVLYTTASLEKLGEAFKAYKFRVAHSSDCQMIVKRGLLIPKVLVVSSQGKFQKIELWSSGRSAPLPFIKQIFRVINHAEGRAGKVFTSSKKKE